MKLNKLPARLATVNTQRIKVLEAKAGTTPRIRGRQWMDTRQRIMLRDRYTCAGCGLVRSDHEVDHIQSLEQGGSNSDTNMQLLCRKHDGGDGCHAAKTKSEAQGRAGR